MKVCNDTSSLDETKKSCHCLSLTEFGGSLSASNIANFIDNGGNVLVTASSTVGDAIRELATEVGLEIDVDGAEVIDHFNYDVSDEGSHTTLVISPDDLIDAPMIVGDKKTIKPLLYRGTGLVSDPDNSLVLPVLSASPTAYSYDPTKPITKYPHAVGKKTLLVAALQARNNARVVFTGSLDMFSDKFFKSPVQAAVGSKIKSQESGNSALVTAISKWVLKEVGVLRFSEVEHRLISDPSAPVPPPFYTIMDDLEYSIKIEILRDGKWVPYDSDDVQLEFVRIDPFVRVFMKRKAGKYQATFKVPDVYGVYKLVVDYRRVGYTHLHSSTQVSVRPLRHTQYERFIRSAYPYYVSAFSMMAGLLLFSVVFLYHNDSTKNKTD